MPLMPPTSLNARKQPRQARSKATLDIIFEATIQVLVACGPRQLTTTRVAQRAGVSVGTLYQYFPHKQALFYALNENYLDSLAEKVENACKAQHGASLEQMIEALITTYWQVKIARPEVTHALYRSVADIDNGPLIQAFSRRVDAATTAMFASAPNVVLTNLPIVNLTLLNTIFGTVRSLFERGLPPAQANDVYRQLVLMCTVYLDAVREHD